MPENLSLNIVAYTVSCKLMFANVISKPITKIHVYTHQEKNFCKYLLQTIL